MHTFMTMTTTEHASVADALIVLGVIALYAFIMWLGLR
jgi:uncharacterized membrane protein